MNISHSSHNSDMLCCICDDDDLGFWGVSASVVFVERCLCALVVSESQH